VKDRIQSLASLLSHRARAHAEPDAGSPAAALDASAPSATASATPTPGGDGGPITLDPGGDGGLIFNTILGDAGAMPSGAPRTVKLGVVLVQFTGAEGASSTARAKPDAFKHAQELVEKARADWKAAVKAGDVGSSEDIGRIPRGVLEHPTELAVFSLAAGDVSEPLETPRGYWVVKRLE
jgi:hypothetical protein